MVAQSGGPSLGEAVGRVRRQYNGRIVSAETRVSGNREVHVIKVLTEDGKVITERIPGRIRNPR
jgi:translation initiation factor IF-1